MDGVHPKEEAWPSSICSQGLHPLGVARHPWVEDKVWEEEAEGG